MSEDKNYIFNNNGKSSPVIIYAECRVKYYGNDNYTYYDCINGKKHNIPYKITIHNYESEALGYDPQIKSEQNYHDFIHLSVLMGFPWGGYVKFKDNDNIMFDIGDIIRLLGERTGDVMKKWKEQNIEFRKRQNKITERVKNEQKQSQSQSTSVSKSKPKKLRVPKVKVGNQHIMEI